MDMKYIMYETGEFATVTGGTKRFRELWDYLSQKEAVAMYATTKNIETGNEKIIQLKTEQLERYGFFRYELTRIALRNKKMLQVLFQQEYDTLFVFDVPSAIGISLLNAKHMCLMCRKDTPLYRRILLESKGDRKVKIALWMMYLNFCEWICLRNAETIIVQCNFDKDQLLRRHKWYKRSIESKLIVQINNVNPRWIVDNSNKKADYLIPTAKRGTNVCCVCNFKDNRKGADIILEAFARCYQGSNDIHLYMIGGGIELEKYMDCYKSHANIHFLGNLSNPISILKQCDFAVVPSRADSCPNTVMEALYNSIPVIGSNAGGIPDILENEDALFEPDVGSLSIKLRQMESEEFREALRRQQQERKCELTFNWPEKILEACKR